MNVRYLLGIVLVLGIAFLGVFLASPSINTVQADEFVLLDGYSGEFASSDASHSFTYYHVEIPETRDDVVIDVPDSFVAIDGYFYHTRNGLVTYFAPIGAGDQWVNKKLIHLERDNSKYEFLVAYLEDGSIDFSKSILAVVPEEYFSGRPINVEVPPEALGDPSKWKDLKPDKDLTNVPNPKTSSTGYAAEVCFNPAIEELPQTGLCNYLTISTYSQLAEVRAEDIPRIKELLAATFEGTKPVYEDYLDTRYATPDDGDVNPTIVYDPENEIVEIDGQVVEKNNNQETIPESEVKNSEESPLSVVETAGHKEAPIFFSPLPTKEAKLFSTPKKILLQSTTTLFYENFEGAFPYTNWTISDIDSTNGFDYWDDIAADSHFGSWSGWPAVRDTSSTYATQWSVVSTDNFSSSLSGWTTIDQNPNSGLDTWAYSTARYVTSPGSAKTAGSTYDTYMTSLLYKNTTYSASSWGSTRVRFWTWYDTTSPSDKLSVILSGNNGNTFTPQCTYSGNSSGWQEKICNVPSSYLTSQFRFGFLFESDGNIEFKEGAYVDKVILERFVYNIDVDNYDDYQMSYMQYGPVSVSGYGGTVFEYWIKGNVETGFDEMTVERSYNGSSWTLIDTISSNFTTWQQKQYNVVSTTGNVYFRFGFLSNSSEHQYLGYYIDDIKVWGYFLQPNGTQCTSPSQCQTGICGGAHVDYRIHCNTDGSSTVYGDQRVFVDACGGTGILDHTNNDFTSGTCSTNKICDADLQYYNSTFTTSQICKTSIPNVCSVSPDCWNDNGGVDCKGSTSKICTYGNNGDYCTENSQCNSNQCISNQCSTGIPNGSACTTDSACASKFCVANVCTATHNPKTVLTDTWDSANSNGISTNTDGHVFVNGTVYPTVTGLREETDMLCYDFDGNGVYDACYYDTNGCGGGGCTANSCNFTIPNSVTNKFACDIDSPAGCRVGIDNQTQAKICTGANCVVDTSVGSQSRQISVKRYTDCDNSSQLRSEDTVVPSTTAEDVYTVYHSKYYRAWDTSNNQINYDAVAQYGYSDTNSNELFSYQCLSTPSVKAVDVVAEEFRVTTPNGVIPDICKKIPGQSCTSNSECLYNVCSGNQCQLSGGIKGHLIDETGHPIAGKVMKLTTCNNTLVAQSTTDASGKYSFYAPAGSYKQKTTAPWGEVTFVWANEPSGCHSFGTGFNVVWSQLYTRANIHGRALNPQGFPSTNLPFEAATCQNTVLDSDTTDAQGYFDLSTDTGYQKINVDLNGNKFPVTTTNGNACIFQYGEVNLGDIEVTANCSLYNNTCDDENPDVRLYNCQSSAANGCSCSTQLCAAGCTEGASACNVVGTGTIKVSVSDANGTSIPYAEVRVNGASKGKTNGYGKKDINVQHGSYAVKVTCPNDPISQTKNAYVNANQKYVGFTLNCPTPSKGDLKIKLNNLNGYPVGNVYLFLDDENQFSGITDVIGMSILKNIPYGQHTLNFVYKVDQNSTPKAFNRQFLINSDSQDLNALFLLPGQPGYESIGVLDASPTFFPLIIEAALIGLYVYGLYETQEQARSYCECLYGDHGNSYYVDCLAGYVKCPTTQLMGGSPECGDWLQRHYSRSCVGKFAGASAGVAFFAGGDKAISAVKMTSDVTGVSAVVSKIGAPVTSAAGQTLNVVKNTVMSHVSDDLVSHVTYHYAYLKEAVASGINGLPIYKGGLDAGIRAVKVSPLTDDGVRALVRVGSQTGVGATQSIYSIEISQEMAKRIPAAIKSGLQIDFDYLGVSQTSEFIENFGDDLAKRTFETIGKLDAKTIEIAPIGSNQFQTISAAQDLGNTLMSHADTAYFATNPATINSAQAQLRNFSFEARSLAHPDYADDVISGSIEAGYKIKLPDNSIFNITKEVDGLIWQNNQLKIIEAKNYKFNNYFNVQGDVIDSVRYSSEVAKIFKSVSEKLVAYPNQPLIVTLRDMKSIFGDSVGAQVNQKIQQDLTTALQGYSNYVIKVIE